jgi:hypothetical protein
MDNDTSLVTAAATGVAAISNNSMLIGHADHGELWDHIFMGRKIRFFLLFCPWIDKATSG